VQPATPIPVGFTASEISSLVNDVVVPLHAEEAAFLWTQRSLAVSAPNYSVDDLATLDRRVEAHLDGLRIAGDAGWKCCDANVMAGGPGEVFALSVLAFGAGSRDRMLQALTAGCASPVARSGLVSALGWLDYRAVSRWIGKLLDAMLAIHREIGIAASAVHRADPGLALAAAVNDPDLPLRCRAIRAVGELKRADLLGDVRRYLRDPDDAIRFWTAWSLSLNGSREGLDILTGWFERDDSFTDRAVQLALRAMSIPLSRQWIGFFARDSRLARLAVIGAGVVGDPASIPWLIRQMESPDLARLAGEAFTMMTGVDLAFHDLDQDAPAAAQDEPDAEPLELTYESDLPFPSARRVADWWGKNGSRFAAGSRYLAGKPLSRESILDTLATGKQRQRRAAALEFALAEPDAVLPEVRARGDRPRRQGPWTS
jgi:uncharacterized protein (TIGR02270 family)